MKNVTFNEKINQFLKNKTKGNPCFAHASIRLRTQARSCTRIAISRKLALYSFWKSLEIILENYTKQVFCILC